MTSIAILQNVSLIALRLGLFFAFRRYLSKSLYPDLASLSLGAPLSVSSTTRSSNISTVELELDVLPSPASLPVDGQSSRRMPSSQKTLHSSVSQAMFSLVLVESCILFLLLVLQATDTFNSSTRLYNWRYSLIFLTVSILAIIPQCMSILLLVGMQHNQSSGRRKIYGVRIAISSIPVIALLFAIAHIPLPKGLTSHDTLTSILSRLIILGTIILGLLSGFGAISNSWGFIPFFSNSTLVPTEQQISSAEYSLSAIRNDLKDKRAIAARKADADSSADRTWLSRVSATFRPGSELEQEIRGLEALEYEMVRKVEALRDARDAAKFSSSWKGRAFRVVGYLFAIYCLVRILSTLANILIPSRHSVSPETTYSDIISELIVYVLSWIYTKRNIRLEDVGPIARQLSLVFVGAMILTSVRLVLRGVTRVLRVTSRSLSASLMLLILAQLMGIYLLSTIVQMRSSFPPPLKSPNNGVNLFSTIPPYEVFGSLFDWSFLIAAVSSTVVLWGAQKFNNAGE